MKSLNNKEFLNNLFAKHKEGFRQSESNRSTKSVQSDSYNRDVGDNGGAGNDMRSSDAVTSDAMKAPNVEELYGVDVFEAINKFKVEEVKRWIEESSKASFIKNRVSLSEAFWQSRKTLGSLSEFNDNYSWLFDNSAKGNEVRKDCNAEADLIPSEDMQMSGGFQKSTTPNISAHEEIESFYEKTILTKNVSAEVAKRYEHFLSKNKEIFKLLVNAHNCLFFEKTIRDEEPPQIDLVMLKSWIENCDEYFVLKELSEEIKKFLENGRLKEEEFLKLVQMSIGVSRVDNVNVFPKSSPKYIGLAVALLSDNGRANLVKKIGTAYEKTSGCLSNTAFVLTLDSLNQLKRNLEHNYEVNGQPKKEDGYAISYHKNLYKALMGTKSLIFEKWGVYKVWEKSSDTERSRIEEQECIVPKKWSASALREWEGWLIGADELNFCWLLSKYQGYIEFLNKTNGFCISLGNSNKFKELLAINTKCEELLEKSIGIKARVQYKECCLELKNHGYGFDKSRQFLWNCDLVSALVFYEKYEQLEMIKNAFPSIIEEFDLKLLESVKKQKEQGEFVKEIKNVDIIWLNLYSSYLSDPYEKFLQNLISVKDLPKLLVGNVAQMSSYAHVFPNLGAVTFRKATTQKGLVSLQKRAPELFMEKNMFGENVFKIFKNYGMNFESEKLLVALESYHLEQENELSKSTASSTGAMRL